MANFLSIQEQHLSENIDLNSIYGGLGDRHQQIVAPSTGSGTGVTTNYTLDLAAGLTQVLDDGTNTYLYGNGRIAQVDSTTEYFLGDALESVRQLADTTGSVTLTQSYSPYGETVTSVGSGYSAYQYTGEIRDSYIKLIYLRSRYYAPETGRFLTKDSWQGDYNRPLSLNRWNYVEGNPVNLIDPSGMIPEKKADEADELVEKLRKYNIQAKKDWGYRLVPVHPSSLPPGIVTGILYSGCEWEEGNWRTIRELRLVKQAVTDMAAKLGGVDRFKSAMGDSIVNVYRINRETFLGSGAYSINNVILPNNVYRVDDSWAKGQMVHELAHVWDTRQTPPFYLSYAMNLQTKYFNSYCDGFAEICPPKSERPPDQYATNNEREDFAQSFAFCMYPNFKFKLRPLGSIRRSYFQSLFNGNQCAQ